jgi:hypothetical protein
MNIKIDWQGLERNGIITYLDFFPFGISFMKIKDVNLLYVWLLLWVVGIAWSEN